MSREPIVSEGDSGLHFINRQVYQDCKKYVSSLQNMVPWSKSVEHSKLDEVAPDIQLFLNFGEISRFLRPNIWDQPPEEIKSRRCIPIVDMRCIGILQTVHSCILEVTMWKYVNNFSSICEEINNMNEKSPDYTSSNLSYASAPNPSTVPSCKGHVVDFDQKSSKSKFNIVFNFNFDNNNHNDNNIMMMPTSSYIRSPYNITDIYCPESLWTSNMPCNASLICSVGFIMVEHSCYKPTRLTLITESRTYLKASLMLDAIVHILAFKETKSYIVVSSEKQRNSKYSPTTDIYTESAKFDIRNYSLPHQGLSGLDLTEPLTTVFMTLKSEWFRLTAGDRIHICIKVDTTDAVDICNNLPLDIGNQSDVHFGCNTTAQTIYDLISANTTDNSNVFNFCWICWIKSVLMFICSNQIATS